MTTEPAGRRSPWQRLGIFVLGAAGALMAWTAILALVTLIQPPGGRVAVLSPAGTRTALSAVVEAGGSIVEVRRWAVITVSDDPGFVGRLYRHGPLVVLGARKGGCGFGAVVGIDPNSLI